MRPAPTMPIVDSPIAASRPTRRQSCHVLRATSPQWGSRLSAARSSATVWSAASAVAKAGRFSTETPRRRAASRSIESRPVPERPMTPTEEASASMCAAPSTSSSTITASASRVSRATASGLRRSAKRRLTRGSGGSRPKIWIVKSPEPATI